MTTPTAASSDRPSGTPVLLTGLLGWPVSHSRSPAMHNAAFAAAGIAGMYAPLPVHPDRVGDAVRGLRALGFRGANVTVPHKQAVIPYLDELSAAARAIGAVNTIVVREDGVLFGDNTDAPGFLADLAEQGIALESVREGGALILGAGGSARAVTYALANAGIRTVVLARRVELAEQLVADLRAHIDDGRWTMDDGELSDALSPDSSPPCFLASSLHSLPEFATSARLIVNCTPLGMTPNIAASPWPDALPFRPDQILYDLVYNPPDTRLMQQARRDGARAFNGLGMLLHQGALAWQLWTGQPAPIEAMWNNLTSDL